jgi:pimeloyl-ACP methyl ester carboxylesterase
MVSAATPAYAQRIPNVETVMLDGSHFLHTDVPESVAAQIVRFVDERLL